MKSKEFLHTLKILALGIIGCLLIGFIAFLAITNPFYENDWLFSLMELICFVVQAVACGVFGVFLAKYSYKGMTPKDAERKIISYKYITIILIILFAVYLLNREMYRNFSDVIMYAGKSGKLLRRTFNPGPIPLIKKILVFNTINPLAMVSYIACFISYAVCISKKFKKAQIEKTIS